MASVDLMSFQHEGKTVFVYTGETSNSVYYRVGSGDSHYSGLTYNGETGWYKSGGRMLEFGKAQMHIRGQL
jgi:hypothetical protein